MKILQERSTAHTCEPWFLAQAEAPAGTALFCGSLPLSAGRTKGKSWGAAADQDQRDTGRWRRTANLRRRISDWIPASG